MEHSLESLKRSVDMRTIALSAENMRVPLGEIVIECKDHGAYTSAGTRYMGKREIWTPCPDCEERRIAAELQAKANEKAERAARVLASMIDEALIPPRFVGRSFDNFIAESPSQLKALEVSKRYAELFDENAKRGAGLIFSGLPGTGKSHLAAAVMQTIMPKHQALYMTCMGMIRAIRGTWRRESETSESEMLSRFGSVPLLVLDEVGVQYGTDGEQTIIFEVMDRRYRDMQPTILLTNQNAKGFTEFVGERVYDRLREVSTWVTFDWPSHRPQKREAA